MDELIKIQKKDGRQLVSARELHQFLEIGRDFSTWIKQTIEFAMFVQGKDYSTIGYNYKGEVIEMNSTPQIGESDNQRVTRRDYAITIEMAKEITMVQKTYKGKQARKYFLDCEKKVKGLYSTVPSDRTTFLAQAYQVAMEVIGERDALIEQQTAIMGEQAVVIVEQATTIEQQSSEIKELVPVANFAKEVLTSNTTWTTNTIAAELGMSAQKLNKLLHQRGVQYKNHDRVWLLYDKYKDCGYTKPRTCTFTRNDGTLQTAMTTTWTEEGRYFIHRLFNKALAC